MSAEQDTATQTHYAVNIRHFNKIFGDVFFAFNQLLQLYTYRKFCNCSTTGNLVA